MAIGFRPQMTALTPSGMNVLPNVLRSASQPAPAMNAPASAPAPDRQKSDKPKRSFGEIVGRVGDILAIMGGEAPVYEFYQQQRMAEQEAAMQQQAFDNFVNNPNDENAFLGALRANVDPKDLLAVRESLAPPAPPEPLKVGAGDRLVVPDGQGGYKEVVSADPRSGTKAKELQIAQLLEERLGKEEADKYLRGLVAGGGMSEYQAAQISIAMERLALERDKLLMRPPSTADVKAAEAAAARDASLQSIQDFLADARAIGERARQQGVLPDTGATPGQRATAIAMENVPFLERVVSGENAQTREELESLVVQNLPELIKTMAGLATGGRNFDAAKELDFWTTAFGKAKTYPAFTATLDRLQRRIDNLSRRAAPASAAPARAPTRTAPTSAPVRDRSAPTRRQGAPTRFRRVNGRLQPVG